MADRLMAAEMPSATPSVAVENASRPDERHVWGSLAELAGKLAEAAPQGPTLVPIGAVVDLAQTREAATRMVT